MSRGHSTEERRESSCDICVKDDFATVKKLVFVILVACVLNVSGAVYVVVAASAKDSQQDSRITAVETNQANILKNQAAQSVKLDKLIDLSMQINLQVQTHVAMSGVE